MNFTKHHNTGNAQRFILFFSGVFAPVFDIAGNLGQLKSHIPVNGRLDKGVA